MTEKERKREGGRGRGEEEERGKTGEREGKNECQNGKNGRKMYEEQLSREKRRRNGR